MVISSGKETIIRIGLPTPNNDMPKKSAGILLYRFKEGAPEVFLVHPGGPFFVKKDKEVWSIPKGEFDNEEDPLTAAKREFFEETGMAPEGNFIALTPVRQKSGKIVTAFALESDIDASGIQSNTFEIEWPPGSGTMQSFPEIDRGEWFSPALAKQKINPSQIALINELLAILRLP